MFDLIAPFWNALLVHPIIAALVFVYGLFSDFGLAVVLATIGPLRRSSTRSTKIETTTLSEATFRSLRSVSWMVRCVPGVHAIPTVKSARACGDTPVRLGGRDGYPLRRFHRLLLRALAKRASSGGDQFATILPPFVHNPIPAGGKLDLTAHWLPWITGGLSASRSCSCAPTNPRVGPIPSSGPRSAGRR